MGLIAGHMKALGLDNAAPVLDDMLEKDERKSATNMAQLTRWTPSATM